MPDARSGEVALRVLVIDREQHIRLSLTTCLESQGHSVAARPSMKEAGDEIARQIFDLIFVDVRLATEGGSDHIPTLVGEYPWTKIIVTADSGLAAAALQAVKLGASDYLLKPFTAAQVEL